MTRADLIRENEALHGLLAHACVTLELIAHPLYTVDAKGVATRITDSTLLARDLLAQIKEGVVP